MELKDTVQMMQSEDYKERFKAEYLQNVIRYQKLKGMLQKWDNGELNLNDPSRMVYCSTLKSKTPQFETSVVGTHKRDIDSEAKLFEHAAEIAKDGKPHTLNLLSERCMCESCRGVMAQFKKTYPNVIVNVVSNSRKQSLKNKDNPWKGRAR